MNDLFGRILKIPDRSRAPLVLVRSVVRSIDAWLLKRVGQQQSLRISLSAK